MQWSVLVGYLRLSLPSWFEQSVAISFPDRLPVPTDGIRVDPAIIELLIIRCWLSHLRNSMSRVVFIYQGVQDDFHHCTAVLNSMPGVVVQ